MDVPRGMLVGTLHIFYKHFDQLDKVKFEQRYETNIYSEKLPTQKMMSTICVYLYCII